MWWIYLLLTWIYYKNFTVYSLFILVWRHVSFLVTRFFSKKLKRDWHEVTFDVSKWLLQLNVFIGVILITDAFSNNNDTLKWIDYTQEYINLNASCIVFYCIVLWTYLTLVNYVIVTKKRIYLSDTMTNNRIQKGISKYILDT